MYPALIFNSHNFTANPEYSLVLDSAVRNGCICLYSLSLSVYCKQFAVSVYPMCRWIWLGKCIPPKRSDDLSQKSCQRSDVRGQRSQDSSLLVEFWVQQKHKGKKNSDQKKKKKEEKKMERKKSQKQAVWRTYEWFIANKSKKKQWSSKLSKWQKWLSCPTETVI